MKEAEAFFHWFWQEKKHLFECCVSGLSAWTMSITIEVSYKAVRKKSNCEGQTGTTPKVTMKNNLVTEK